MSCAGDNLSLARLSRREQLKQKIYLIQPTYRAYDGKLLQGKHLHLHSCAIPALAAAIPPDWEQETCLEYFENVHYDNDASIVAITSMGYDILHGREIAEEFRRRGKIVIFGGYQAHLCRGEIRDVANCIVHGYPGPKAMAQILEDALAGCLEKEYDVGIDINFPFDYSMLPRRRILFMPVLASVGCHNNCDFCCIAAQHNGEYRLRKVKHVLTDILEIRKHTRRFFLIDSNFYNNRSYMIRLCDEITRIGRSFFWGADATIDIGEDDEALRALRRAGCRILYIGFETPNQQSLNAVNKPYNAAAYSSAVARIKQHGIAVAGFFMVGMDGDTTETFDDLFSFIHDSRVNLPILNIVVPVPETALFKRLDREGRLTVNTIEGYLKNALFFGSSSSRSFFRPAQMTVNELEEGMIDLRLRLSSAREIVSRSLFPDPVVAAILLIANIQIGRDARRYIAAWEATKTNSCRNEVFGAAIELDNQP
jgi:hypothetical protein